MDCLETALYGMFIDVDACLLREYLHKVSYCLELFTVLICIIQGVHKVGVHRKFNYFIIYVIFPVQID